MATLSEAEVFAAAGVDDLFIAYPVWVDPPQAARLTVLAASVALRVGVDSAAGARALAAALGGVPVQVLVELDCGMGRTGARTARCGPVIAGARRRALRWDVGVEDDQP